MKNLLKTEDYNSLSETDFTRVVYDELSDMVYIENPIPSIYEWVDLGLPSGTKWSTTNIGASVPEERGLYFAWGEVVGYDLNDPNIKTFCKEYKYGELGSNKYIKTFTKYNNTDMLTQLELIDDAAYVSDNTSIMPLPSHYNELMDNTNSVEETLNNVKGKRFTSKINGNSIFIPYYSTLGHDEEYNNMFCGNSSGCYGLWTSLRNADNVANANVFVVGSNRIISSFARFTGMPIRPIKK